MITIVDRWKVQSNILSQPIGKDFTMVSPATISLRFTKFSFFRAFRAKRSSNKYAFVFLEVIWSK